MTIRRGEEWGETAPLGTDGVIVEHDHAARKVVEASRGLGERPPHLGFVGGDLWRALGAPTGGNERLRGPLAHTAPCDLGIVRLDGVERAFVAHCIIRHSWWWGRVIAVMNVEWCGAWRIAPKAHPNDGLLDIVDGSLSTGQRWLARRRLVTGDHLPHPGIRSFRTNNYDIELSRPTSVWLDGERVGAAQYIEVALEADALTVVV